LHLYCIVIASLLHLYCIVIASLLYLYCIATLKAQAVQRQLPASKIKPPINVSAAAAPNSNNDPKGEVLRLHVDDWSFRTGGTNCGLPPKPLNTTLPNVLIIGDSVSDSGSGYGPNVRALLELNTSNGNSVGNNPRNNGPLAIVQHNGGWSPEKGANEQASNSANGTVRVFRQQITLDE
jgi:hypothetical protein